MRRRLVLRDCRRRGRHDWSRRLRLRLCGLDPRQHGCRSGSSRCKYREDDRGKHENDRRPGGCARKNRSGAARSECCLATLSAKSRGQVAALSALQQHNGNQEEANNDVNDGDENGYPHAQYSNRAEARIPQPLNRESMREIIFTPGKGDSKTHIENTELTDSAYGQQGRMPHNPAPIVR